MINRFFKQKKPKAGEFDYEVARIDYAIIVSETYKTDEAIEQYKKVINNKPKFIKIIFIWLVFLMYFLAHLFKLM